MIGFKSRNSSFVLIATGIFAAGRLLVNASPIAADIVSSIGAAAVVIFAVRVLRDFQKMSHG